MTLAHERHVSERFDAVEGRFRAEVAPDDYRLRGVLQALGPVAGLRVLDLGCGKGRFARHLARLGAEVVGLDASRGMLAHAGGLDRVLASASRLPFASRAFDAVVAVEMFEHLSREGVDRALAEIARVLKPGGRVAIVDKNLHALDALRPWLPKVAVKAVDERRGRWMYAARGPVRERWFAPGRFADRLRLDFDEVNVEFLMSPEESRRAIFRAVPRIRLMASWTARVPTASGHREPSGTASTNPDLPLVLWGTPPALERILMQEGVPFRKVANPADSGRFVLFDGRFVSPRSMRDAISPDQVAIDVDGARRDGDPFAALIDDRSSRMTWTIGGLDLTERIGRFDKAAIRRRVVAWLRARIERSGGVWARLAPFPHPYRSAFNFRVDLDEPCPHDYARFARARRPIDDCSTHFVSTAAYGDLPEVLADLARVDAQSHGHFHHVYRSEAANARNLGRADALLRGHGFEPSGFAAPSGRWNAGLDRAIASLGYGYSSDFSLGCDDLPFWPVRDGRRSPVLQIPVHPICEGLFLDAGCDRPSAIADHLVATVRAKAASGEPAFVYGHPERRLGRFPEVVSTLASAVADLDGTWRVTLTEFARWWRWRADRAWSLAINEAGLLSVDSSNWDAGYPTCLEISCGDRVARVALTAASQVIDPSSLAYSAALEPWVGPLARPAPRPRGLRAAVRSALDWETVTPVADLPEAGLRDRLKKRLRRMRGPIRPDGGPPR